MNKHITLILFLVLLAFTGVSYADVITNDPNVQPKEVVINEQPVDNPDPRLAQKIAYQSTGQRLHTVCDELTKQTGVAIRSGSSPKDWQVRDIPVVVCVKDLPLSKILESLAAVTHLALAASKDDKGVISYRIFRDMKRKAQLEDYDRKVKDAATAKARWDWDALVEASKMPDLLNKLNEYVGDNPYTYENTQHRIAYGQLLSDLGTDARDKILQGQKITITAQDTSKQLVDLTKKIVLSIEAERNEYRRKSSKSENIEQVIEQDKLKEEDLQKARIELYAEGDPVQIHLVIQCPELQAFGTLDGAVAGYNLIKGIPPSPENPEPPKTDYLDSLKIIYGDEPGVFKTKVKIPKPKGMEYPTYSEVIAECAKTSKFSIIAEDFISHDMRRYAFCIPRLCGTEVAFSRAVNMSQLVWRVDEQSRLLVGSSIDWVKDHESMVPEELAQYAKEKIDGDGIDLDDFLKFARLTDAQRQAWITPIYPPGPLDIFKTSNLNQESISIALWRFYDSLSPSDKEAAKSKTGLPLIKCDVEYLSKVIADGESNTSKDYVPPFISKDSLPITQLPVDSDAVARFAMHIIRVEEKTYVLVYKRDETNGSMISTRLEYSADGFKRYKYKMIITGEDKTYEANWPWGFNDIFPNYSEKREFEKLAEVQKKQQAPSLPTQQ